MSDVEYLIVSVSSKCAASEGLSTKELREG